MFERFTATARESVQLAEREAHELGHGYIGTEHLLIALARQADAVASDVLGEFGVTAADLRQDALHRLAQERGRQELDRDALASIGIDLDEVRRCVEETFGPGALERARAPQDVRGRGRGLTRLFRGRRRRRRCAETARRGGRTPFTPHAKKALELSLRAAVGWGDKVIGTEHILLGVARADNGHAAGLLTRRAITAERLQAAVERRRRAA